LTNNFSRSRLSNKARNVSRKMELFFQEAGLAVGASDI